MFNLTFLDYAQARGFAIDPARVRRPTDKPRVENAVRYGRSAGLRGENFVSLKQARESMSSWARDEAGNRIHRTTRRRPKEHFGLEERHLLMPAPESDFDVPIYSEAKVGRDLSRHTLPSHLAHAARRYTWSRPSRRSRRSTGPPRVTMVSADAHGTWHRRHCTSALASSPFSKRPVHPPN